MNEKRLSGLGMLLIRGGTNYKPESEDIYKINQNWRKWQSHAFNWVPWVSIYIVDSMP